MARALQAQGAMTATGTHRVKVSDLVIAAAATEVGVTVLHYDVDFERIASATGQPTEWAVRRGSIG
jgi:predicted nucleic acid-binding protein